MSQEQYECNEELKWLEAEREYDLLQPYYNYTEESVDFMVNYYKEQEDLQIEQAFIDLLQPTQH